jgi:hypothetical protein
MSNIHIHYSLVYLRIIIVIKTFAPTPTTHYLLCCKYLPID